MQIKQEKGHYTLYKESEAIGTAVVDGAAILRLEIVPAWRGRGYGSYLVKELLRRGGGLDPKQATRFTAPLPRDEAVYGEVDVTKSRKEKHNPDGTSGTVKKYCGNTRFLL